MDLEGLLEDTVDYTNMLIDVVTKRDTLARTGGLCNNIARYYRAMGIYDFLVNIDVDGFFYGVIQSGLTRKYYLDRCIKEDTPDEPGMMSSFVGPFFDAVAANQFKLGRQIAVVSPKAWMQGYEYEDDFAYSHFFHCMPPFGDSDPQGLEAVLTQFENALEGQKSERLDMCRALLAKDQAVFDEAFAALLELHQTTMEETVESGSTLSQEYEFEANRRIFVEGLAILRIAEMLGLETEEEYNGCPAIVRTTDYQFESDAFPNIGLDS